MRVQVHLGWGPGRRDLEVCDVLSLSSRPLSSFPFPPHSLLFFLPPSLSFLSRVQRYGTGPRHCLVVNPFQPLTSHTRLAPPRPNRPLPRLVRVGKDSVGPLVRQIPVECRGEVPLNRPPRDGVETEETWVVGKKGVSVSVRRITTVSRRLKCSTNIKTLVKRMGLPLFVDFGCCLRKIRTSVTLSTASGPTPLFFVPRGRGGRRQREVWHRGWFCVNFGQELPKRGIDYTVKTDC